MERDQKNLTESAHLTKNKQPHRTNRDPYRKCQKKQPDRKCALDKEQRATQKVNEEGAPQKVQEAV